MVRVRGNHAERGISRRFRECHTLELTLENEMAQWIEGSDMVTNAGVRRVELKYFRLNWIPIFLSQLWR